MTLEEFRELLNKETQRFYEEWLAAEKHPATAHYYAHSMSEDEWWEQYTTWHGMGAI